MAAGHGARPIERIGAHARSLMQVIFDGVDAKMPQGLAAITIGAAVALHALFAGSVIGASMRPARRFAPERLPGFAAPSG